MTFFRKHAPGRTRRAAVAALAAAGTLALGAGPAALAQTPDKVRIGYVISKSGPNAAGAGTTTLPNYQLWVKEVNAAGGLNLGGKRVPIEVIEYDDRSQSEETVRAIERLMTQDKVDFILPPWGTALNLAVAPLLNRGGYPHLAVTAISERIPELAQRWPNTLWLAGLPSMFAESLVELLKQQRDAGKINDRVVMLSVADAFGIELAKAGKPALEKAGFKIAVEKSYPLGTQDLAPLIAEAKASGADTFIAFSYPPDTIGLTDQARIAQYNPKIFYTAVGTAFPVFKQRFGKAADGVAGIGGWLPNDPKQAAYFKKHVEVTGREPDRWYSPVTYASLQMLQQAIEKVGKVDRAAVINELANGTFDTVIGPIKLTNRQHPRQWAVAQWQDGEFVALAPRDVGPVKPLIVPKPAWPAQ
jgi:branched-chain amino acid transport system substrate-binding protein